MATDKRQFLNINQLNFRMWFKNLSGRMGQNLRN